MKSIGLNVFGVLSVATMMAACTKPEKHDIDYPEYILETGYDGLELVWTEDFENAGLPDAAQWEYEEGYQRDCEMQDYKAGDAKFARIEDGNLVIEAHRDVHGEFEFSSASLISKARTFGNGRLDIYARIPVGRGLCPSFMLVPADDKDGAANIQIMKYWYGGKEIANRVHSTVNSEYIANGAYVESGYANSESFGTAYHLFSVVRTDDAVRIYVDNRQVFSYAKPGDGADKWPFSQELSLMMNVAVGGTYGGAFSVDTKLFPSKMKVDYIKFYAPADSEY